MSTSATSTTSTTVPAQPVTGSTTPVSRTETPAVAGVVADASLTVVARRALATLRIAVGLTFLWAFFDKLLALGWSTGRTVDPTTGAESMHRLGSAAWIHGGSPTLGFLKYGASGPLADFYHSIAGTAWADWAFMLGLLGIGTALTLGVGIRAAAAAGVVLYLMMWSVTLPPANNPVLDDHVLGAITLVVLAATGAGSTWGFGRQWSRVPLVARTPYLR